MTMEALTAYDQAWMNMNPTLQKILESIHSYVEEREWSGELAMPWQQHASYDWLVALDLSQDESDLRELLFLGLRCWLWPNITNRRRLEMHFADIWPSCTAILHFSTYWDPADYCEEPALAGRTVCFTHQEDEEP